MQKPYFQLDAVNRYTLLGSIDNQGVELSATGAVTPRLDIVAGAVLAEPRVSGDGVRLGLVGRSRSINLGFESKLTLIGDQLC